MSYNICCPQIVKTLLSRGLLTQIKTGLLNGACAFTDSSSVYFPVPIPNKVSFRPHHAYLPCVEKPRRALIPKIRLSRCVPIRVVYIYLAALELDDIKKFRIWSPQRDLHRVK